MSKLKFKIDDEGYLNVSEDGGCSWEAIGLVKGDASTEAGPEGPAGPCGAPGANGQDGQDGITPYISDNGTWVVGGVDTGIIAAGRNGEVDVEASDDITVVGTPSVTWRLENGKTFIKFHELKGESGDKITAEKSEGVTIIYVNNEEVAVINDGKTYHNGQWISIDETDAINCILKEGEGITIATDGTISCDIESLPSGNIGDVYYIDQENSNHVDPMQILTYDAFIENDDELNYLKTRSITLDKIYNDWQAFSHLGDTDTTPATSEMLTEKANPKSFWTYNSVAKTMVCSKNSVTYLGFVDNKNFVDHYTLQAKLHSTDGDNDSIAIIIAYYKDSQGKEYTLSAVRTRNNYETHTIADYNLDGSLRPSSSKPLPMWAIVYNYKQVDSRLIASTNITGDTSDSWSKTTGTIVKIVRNGNNIQCSASPYGSTTIDSSSIINIDLDSIGILNVFKGKRQYGVGCFSQPASTFSDITIQLANVIYDMRDGSGWVYTATIWTKIANKLYDDFSVGRILNSQDFNKSYYIDVPGHNIKINDDNKGGNNTFTVNTDLQEVVKYNPSEENKEISLLSGTGINIVSDTNGNITINKDTIKCIIKSKDTNYIIKPTLSLSYGTPLYGWEVGINGISSSSFKVVNINDFCPDNDSKGTKYQNPNCFVFTKTASETGKYIGLINTKGSCARFLFRIELQETGISSKETHTMGVVLDTPTDKSTFLFISTLDSTEWEVICRGGDDVTEMNAYMKVPDSFNGIIKIYPLGKYIDAGDTGYIYISSSTKKPINSGSGLTFNSCQFLNSSDLNTSSLNHSASDYLISPSGSYHVDMLMDLGDNPIIGSTLLVNDTMIFSQIISSQSTSINNLESRVSALEAKVGV